MHNTNPETDPSYVGALKKRLDSRHSGQRELDKKMLDLHLQTHVIEGRKPDPDISFRPVGSGLAGLVVDQDVAVLLTDPSHRVAPRGGSDAERHASDVLEPFTQTAWNVMQKYVAVWDPMVMDARVYGRVFALGPLPAPFFWGGDELRALYDELTGGNEAARAKITEYMSVNFPIVWRHWSAKDVRAIFNERGEPAEVMFVRKMYAGDIQDRFGEDALPAKRGAYQDSQPIEVIDYVNTKYCATVVPDNADPKVINNWEHRMRCCPVTFADTGRLPENERGWMWAGAVFHLRELIPSIDDTLTDMRTLIRESPTSPPVAYIDVQQRGELEGWPTNIQVKQGETVNMLTGEKLERAPVPQINVDLFQYLGIARSLADMVGVRREALMGMGPSGQSAVHLSEANQIAKAELKKAHKGLERAATRVDQLLFRSVIALSEEFPEAPDKVTIRPANGRLRSKEIAVGPDDVRGWEELVSATISLSLPVNEGANVTNAGLCVQGGLLDMWSARERFLDVDNPAEIDDRRAEWELFQAAVEIAKQVMTARMAGGMENVGALTDQQVQQQSADLPQFAQNVLAKSYQQGNGTQPLGRSAANVSRTGRGQRASQLAGTGVALPPGSQGP